MFVYKAQEKRKKKLTGEILVKTNSPSLPPTLFPFCGKQRQKEFTSLTFRWRREAKEIHFSLIGHQEGFESEKWRTKYLASVFRNTIRQLRRLNTKEMKVERQNLSSGFFAHEVVGKRRNEIKQSKNVIITFLVRQASISSCARYRGTLVSLRYTWFHERNNLQIQKPSVN